MYAKLQTDLSFPSDDLADVIDPDNITLRKFRHIYLAILEQQRSLLHKMNRQPEIDEELIRKHLSLIDLEEFKVREKIRQE